MDYRYYSYNCLAARFNHQPCDGRIHSYSTGDRHCGRAGPDHYRQTAVMTPAASGKEYL
jgi:hypothetical protein